MRISEIAEITGLNISNIRFYERKGLINPDRKTDSKYRDYTDADLDRIKEIMLYRKAGLSIEVINELLTGDAELGLVLQEHIESLRSEKDNVEEKIMLCEALLLEENPDVEYYLNNKTMAHNVKLGLFSKMDDIYEEYVEYSTNILFNRENWLTGFIPIQWKRRIGALVWLILTVVLPVIQLCVSLNHNGFSYAQLLYSAVFVVINYGFVEYHLTKKNSIQQSL